MKEGRLHADTASFSVHGWYEPYAQDLPEALETPELLRATERAERERAEADGSADGGAPTVIEVTYGYSRDHWEDLKQWMLALVTSGEGIPQFPQSRNTTRATNAPCWRR